MSRFDDCVAGVAGVPFGSRSRHLFIPTQEVAVRSSSEDAVDTGLRINANRAVRPAPLVRNDLVRKSPTPAPNRLILKKLELVSGHTRAGTVPCGLNGPNDEDAV